jgi:HSP20 family protein
MAIIKWHPMREIQDIRRDMDRMFSEFFEGPRRHRGIIPRALETGLAAPSIEMVDRKSDVVLKAELPGVNKEDVELTVHDGDLTLKGEFKADKEVKEEDYYFSERRYGSFERTVTLPVEVDADKAKATYKNGVLEVALPKKKTAKPKEVNVQVA